MTASPAEERRLVLALAAASDTALTRVVALVDSLENRAEADRVLERARPRLRHLRPPRPLRLPRLLFLPLGGAIRDAAAWQRGSGQLPRSALAPLAASLRSAAPEGLARLEAACEGQSCDDPAATGRIGRELWALAAAALPEALPAGWAEATGLRDGDHAPLRQLCVAVWRQAGPLWDAVEAAAAGPPEPLLRAALAGPAAAGEAVFGAALATLLRHAAAPGTVAAIAAGLGPTAGRIAEQALDGFVATAAPELDAAEPARGASAVRRFLQAMADLEASPLCRKPERRRQLQQLRHEVDLACRSAFATGVETQLVDPIGRLVAAAADCEVDQLEAAARGLKQLEAAGRSVGSESSYDRALRSFGAALEATGARAAAGGLTRVDLARIAEILCGPETALRLLPADGPAVQKSRSA